ncbi:hypothetical protein LTR36_005757 [Oleoguttula mirabilis]|uniref:Glucose-methanol-choline oxidoreductase N-terminal domain-containing protein n=1 Tax=Oleoguttula mirabilis TaxID=1507867 RepID=A0AAV9JDN1_9PEZI|nr:hypothetical protein LTR36_005757 [Oleoguttula mirabilis]
MPSLNKYTLLLVVIATLALATAQQSYDFIVVGGGTAGIAVAVRLSQKLIDSSILLIEAGPDGRDVPAIYTPGHRGSALGSIYDWNFTTTPQPYANDRVITQNRGKVLGGSSALNLEAWDRGVKADYDAWEELGNPGWNWTTIHAAMKAQETFQITPTKGEDGIVGVGTQGPIHFLVNRFSPAQQELFFPSMQNLGLNETHTFLDGDMVGYMRHTSMILGSNYTRSYSPAFLPLAGPNLHLLLGTMVAKINLNKSSCATGVTLTNGTVILAKKEVILSAGSIQSPQLLELSGVGSKSVLEAAGIKQLVDLPGVGENLQDHVRITTAYQLESNYTSPDELRFNATFVAEQLALYEANKTSFYDETSSGYAYGTWQQMTGNNSYFVALAKEAANSSNLVDQKKLENLEDLSKRVPQLEVLFDDGYLGNKGYPVINSSLYGAQFFTLIASINHGYARGSVHINSSDVAKHPVLNPNYLSNEYDLQAVAQGAKFLRKIAYTEPFRSAIVDEYEPGLDTVSTDADWVEYAKANVLTIWHPLGTCALLPREEGGVVDPELRVYGVTGLRVVDASVIPILVSGHIQTSVYAIAERAAEMIGAQWS